MSEELTLPELSGTTGDALMVLDVSSQQLFAHRDQEGEGLVITASGDTDVTATSRDWSEILKAIQA
jgi:hypothetical protein